MNWINILNKNKKEFQKEILKKKKIEENIIDDINLKDYEEEFNYLYSSKIIDIKIDFKEYIDKLSLPFLDNNILNIDKSFLFYDFIKYNCYDLNKIKNKIDKENDEYLKEIEEEELSINQYENFENYQN